MLYKSTPQVCSVDGCERPVKARGFCNLHYQRWSNGNDMQAPPKIAPLETRFWYKVSQRAADECWDWIGQLNWAGYGTFPYHGQKYMAHRLAYELSVSPVPEGLCLDHLCRNRRCCNPAHLEPVTMRENIIRGEGRAAINARKTHCRNGHEYTLENTRVRDGKRTCRACDRDRGTIRRKLRIGGERSFDEISEAE